MRSNTNKTLIYFLELAAQILLFNRVYNKTLLTVNKVEMIYYWHCLSFNRYLDQNELIKNSNYSNNFILTIRWPRYRWIQLIPWLTWPVNATSGTAMTPSVTRTASASGPSSTISRIPKLVIHIGSFLHWSI